MKYCWETVSTEKELRDHTQPEDTSKDKEIKGSAGENLNLKWNVCLTHFRCSCQYAFMTTNVLIFCDFV